MALEIIKTTAEQMPLIANLVELYVYDLNEIAPEMIRFELDDTGRFGYPRFSRFWDQKGCAAYLFKYNGRPAGFCLTHNSPFFNKDKDARVIGEFGILKMYRNQGIGVHAASHIMREQPGFWEMRVIDENRRAVYFWNKVLRTVTTNNNYVIHEKHDHEWIGKVFVGQIT